MECFILDLMSKMAEEIADDPQDIEFLPEVPVLPINSTEIKETVSEAMVSLDISPIKFQLKRKSMDKVSQEFKRKMKQKYKRAELKFKEKFAEAVAPGQQQEMLQLLVSSESENDEETDDTMKSLRAAYDTSDSLSRYVREILDYYQV